MLPKSQIARIKNKKFARRLFAHYEKKKIFVVKWMNEISMNSW